MLRQRSLPCYEHIVAVSPDPTCQRRELPKSLPQPTSYPVTPNGVAKLLGDREADPPPLRNRSQISIWSAFVGRRQPLSLSCQAFVRTGSRGSGGGIASRTGLGKAFSLLPAGRRATSTGPHRERAGIPRVSSVSRTAEYRSSFSTPGEPNSGRQLFAALGATAGQNPDATLGRHTFAETVPALAHQTARLICAFHVVSPDLAQGTQLIGCPIQSRLAAAATINGLAPGSLARPLKCVLAVAKFAGNSAQPSRNPAYRVDHRQSQTVARPTKPDEHARIIARGASGSRAFTKPRSGSRLLERPFSFRSSSFILHRRRTGAQHTKLLVQKAHPVA